MQRSSLALLLTGTLALASCGQQTTTSEATAPSAPETSTTAPLTTNLSEPQIQALQARIQQVRQLQADIQAGTAQAPQDEAGRAIDLNALLQSMQDDLQEGLQARAPEQPGLRPLAVPYSSSVYTSIAANDSFRSQYWTLRNRYPAFNWGTDGCSGPANYTGWSDEFYWPCRQHDFGYRNARHYSWLLNETHRHWLDGQFKQHMNSVCDTLGWRKYACYAAAQAFYTAVYYRGKSSFYP